MNPLIVLSLFDGMSCGLTALKRAEIPVKKYYASEIDKYAIQIAKKNHPEIEHLGDVTLWQQWQIEKPDLIMGGSPCQGFSFSGKQLAFDDPRSKLFFTMVDIINYYKPKYRLLENVRMKTEYRDVITQHMGVEPVRINSALVSAQNRVRDYWCNWEVTQPEDKKIYLKDIVEEGFVDREKSFCIDANYAKGGNPKQYFGKSRRQLVFDKRTLSPRAKKQIRGLDEKAYSSTATCYKGIQSNGMTTLEITGGRMVWHRLDPDTGKRDDYNHDIAIEQRVETRNDGKAGCLTTVTKDSLACIQADDIYYRKLTPIECERLMGLEDNYTEGVSNSQRYKMLGNGWEANTMLHIFTQLNKKLTIPPYNTARK